MVTEERVLSALVIVGFLLLATREGRIHPFRLIYHPRDLAHELFDLLGGFGRVAFLAFSLLWLDWRLRSVLFGIISLITLHVECLFIEQLLDF